MNGNVVEKNQSLPLALILSFLVGAVGAALWGLLYYYGGFASVVSFLTSYLMIVVYQKYYPKKDWKCYTWVAVVSIVLNLLACYETLIIATMIEANCSHALATEAFFDVIGEIAGDLIYDSIMIVIFSAIGVVGYYFMDKKKQQTAKNTNGNTIRPTTYTTIESKQTEESDNNNIDKN